MSVLIDGYNLMHAVGMPPPPAGTQAALASARRRFLDWLADSAPIKANPTAVRVVFDAQNSKKDHGTTTHRGLTVTFSFRQTADDLIEALVSIHPQPQQLRIVSNDSRLRDFARRKMCQHLSSDAFLQWLMTPPKVAGQKPVTDDKPPPDWPDEMESLLKAFG
ncbi:MAG: NYN domain-containing protein [Fimbriiglobus sp.]|jgi:predicted RNA-binding protein with PIN domain|nr:NYN domain-containing protein [Fimbriiglobus sp.]